MAVGYGEASPWRMTGLQTRVGGIGEPSPSTRPGAESTEPQLGVPGKGDFGCLDDDVVAALHADDEALAVRGQIGWTDNFKHRSARPPRLGSRGMQHPESTRADRHVAARGLESEIDASCLPIHFDRQKSRGRADRLRPVPLRPYAQPARPATATVSGSSASP